MVFKIHKYLKSQEGLSLVELTLVVFIATFMLTGFFIFSDPVNKRKTARDNKRLADLANLERIINEYHIDNGEYPDTAGVVRISTSLPDGGVSLTSALGGWILENFTQYTSKVAIDPVNDETYFYSYSHTDFGYELNAQLEHLTERMTEDGGNDPARYETGNDLSIL
jgi:Flp pilus assembly pilin Flp